MPIFVSRFSPGRVGGANLQGLRPVREERERPGRVGREDQEQRAERTERQSQNRGRAVGRTGIEALPASTQQAESLLERLRSQQGERTRDTGRGRQTAAAGRDDDGADDAPGVTRRVQTGRAEARTQARPSVSAARTRADEGVERPGRLDPGRANPALQQALGRFERLRGVAQGARAGAGRAEEVRANLPQAAAPQTPPLDRETDAQIRLLANQARASRTTLQTEAGTERPTATEISRANTTPEIRENLEADVRQVSQGLQRDVATQMAANTRETGRAAAEALETRIGREVSSGEVETRELRTEERRLERELRETQRELRSEENRMSRLEGSANRSTAATAAAVGTQVNILAA